MATIEREDIDRIKKSLNEHRVKLPDGSLLPRLGQGTWYIGDSPSTAQEEISMLRFGVELGMNLIDTAEMYGDGRSESLVGEAIEGIRDQVFLVSKVYPHHSGLSRIGNSCEESLRRLKTDRLARQRAAKRDDRWNGETGRRGENSAVGRLQPGYGGYEGVGPLA